MAKEGYKKRLDGYIEKTKKRKKDCYNNQITKCPCAFLYVLK